MPENKRYKLAQGYFADYKPQTEHKDMLYLCKDKRAVYLNGVCYEGCGLVINIEKVYDTVEEIRNMPDPKEGLVFYCLEDNNTYQYTNDVWHTRAANPGDFFNAKDYKEGANVYQNKFVYFNGKTLKSDYEGTLSYALDNINQVIYWYEGE